MFDLGPRRQSVAARFHPAQQPQRRNARSRAIALDMRAHIIGNAIDIDRVATDLRQLDRGLGLKPIIARIGLGIGETGEFQLRPAIGRLAHAVIDDRVIDIAVEPVVERGQADAVALTATA